jgi:CAAD domains of cyanobacterial aminoacyl-tRNA synthetase
MANETTIAKKNDQQQLDSDLAAVPATAAAPGEDRLMSVDDYLNRDLAIAPNQTTIDRDINESPQELWVDIQTNKPAILVEDTLISIEKLFTKNRYILTLIGLSILAIMALIAFFAGLDAIDDLPLVTPILKIVGLISGARFVWRYLMRQQNRQELFKILNSAKMEVLGR